MNIVGVTACTTGVAHTSIAKEKLMDAARARGIPSSLKHRAASAFKMN